MAINKNIFQLHNSYAALGPFERVSIERWRVINPDWNYRFILQGELDEYILDTWSLYADTYQGMDVIQRSEIIRAAVVYQNGGVFSDCDIYPIHRLDDFIPTDSTAAWFKLKDREDKQVLIADYFFGAEKGNPVLNDIINEGLDRTKHIERPDITDQNRYTGFIYGTSGIHAWSDIVVGKYNEPLLSGGDNYLPDIEANPEGCHFYHYSVESWIPNNRFKRDGRDPFADEMAHLEFIKNLTGI